MTSENDFTAEELQRIHSDGVPITLVQGRAAGEWKVKVGNMQYQLARNYVKNLKDEVRAKMEELIPPADWARAAIGARVGARGGEKIRDGALLTIVGVVLPKVSKKAVEFDPSLTGRFFITPADDMLGLLKFVGEALDGN